MSKINLDDECDCACHEPDSQIVHCFPCCGTRTNISNTMWYENDKFYQELDIEEKLEFIKQVTSPMISSAQSIGKKYRGAIRDCPICKEKRTTDPTPCSCTSCKTCGYKWFCYYLPKQELDTKYSFYIKEISPDYIDFP